MRTWGKMIISVDEYSVPIFNLVDSYDFINLQF